MFARLTENPAVRTAIFATAIAVSAFTVYGIFTNLLTTPWRGVALLGSALLWVAYLNASIHRTVSEEIRLRMDRLQDELLEAQDRHERRIQEALVRHEQNIKEELDRHIDQVGLLRRVLHDLDERYSTAPAQRSSHDQGEEDLTSK